MLQHTGNYNQFSGDKGNTNKQQGGKRHLIATAFVNKLSARLSARHGTLSIQKDSNYFLVEGPTRLSTLVLAHDKTGFFQTQSLESHLTSING